jgi:transposase
MSKTMKIITLSILALFVLGAGASCVPGDTASLIESLLKNTDSGQMTFVTSDGEEVIVTLSKTGRTISNNVTTANTLTKTVKPVTATVKPTTSKSAITATIKPATGANLADYLPVLNSIEDVFKTLGVWDKAYELQKKGLSWAKIAAELGYDKDSMYAKVLELNKEKLFKAKELGLIDQATYEYKIKYYGELALKYITKIFSEATTPAVSLSNYLPVLNSIEDIFKTLSVWDKAYELQKKGLGWAQIAAELGYDKDSMYAKVLELNKEKLYKAKELGLIDQSTYEYKVKYFGELALKYITKIFAEPTKTPAVSLSNYLPVLNSIEDVFKTLGQWEQASAKYAKGYRWSQIAADLGYDKDSMYAHLLEFNEEKLGQAYELGLIDKAALEYKIKLYGDQGLKWIEKIFAS